MYAVYVYIYLLLILLKWRISSVYTWDYIFYFSEIFNHRTIEAVYFFLVEFNNFVVLAHVLSTLALDCQFKVFDTLLIIFFEHLFYFKLHVSVCIFECICCMFAGALRGQKRLLDLLGPELQVDVKHPLWLLGIKHRTLERIMHTLNYRVLSPAQVSIYYKSSINSY